MPRLQWLGTAGSNCLGYDRFDYLRLVQASLRALSELPSFYTQVCCEGWDVPAPPNEDTYRMPLGKR